MTFPQNRFWRWSLYVIYALLLITLLLYLRFPTQKFKAFCTHLISLHLPGYENSIESLHYQFPLTLVARDLQLQSNDKAAKETFNIEQLTITPTLTAPAIPGSHGIRPSLAVTAPGKNFSISITAYGGTHHITLALDRAHNTFTLPKIDINGADLKKLPWLQAQTGRAITGLLTAQGSYSGQTGQDISRGSGQGSAQIKNGTVELLDPILSLKDIAIEKGETLFKLYDQKIVLSNGKFIGKELEGTFSGQISSLDSPVAAMQFDLTGTLTPLPALVKKSGQAQPLLLKLQKNHAALPFQLKGTIGKPAFLFDS